MSTIYTGLLCVVVAFGIMCAVGALLKEMFPNACDDRNW